jgi:MinD superfamily P-loop ATPase
VRGSDFALLVTEPTPFGLNDLMLAVEMARVVDVPFGVLVNRSDHGDDEVRRYCEREGIPILMEIPFDRELAQVCSRGGLAVEALPRYRELFSGLLERLLSKVEV